MEALRKFLFNIENYGNCEFYARDYDYTNTSFKYVLTISEEKIIKLKKYWCVYESCFFDGTHPDYLNSPLKYQEYVNDNFYDNISEILLASNNDDVFVVHNLSLDNDSGTIAYNILASIIKYILEDFNFLNYYLSSNIEKTYEYISNRIKKLFSDNVVLNDINPLTLDEIIDNFKDYCSLSRRDYKKISKAITADEYDSALRKLKFK